MASVLVIRGIAWYMRNIQSDAMNHNKQDLFYQILFLQWPMTLHAPQKSNFRPLNKDDIITRRIFLSHSHFSPYVCFRDVSLLVEHVHNNLNTCFILLGHAFVRKWVLLSAPADKDEDEVWYLFSQWQKRRAWFQFLLQILAAYVINILCFH